jgi:hypothetical protein
MDVRPFITTKEVFDLWMTGLQIKQIAAGAEMSASYISRMLYDAIAELEPWDDKGTRPGPEWNALYDAYEDRRCERVKQLRAQRLYNRRQSNGSQT